MITPQAGILVVATLLTGSYAHQRQFRVVAYHFDETTLISGSTKAPNTARSALAGSPPLCNWATSAALGQFPSG